MDRTNSNYLSGNLSGSIFDELIPRENDTPTTEQGYESDIDKIRQIRIEEVDLGFIVGVGCQTFAITEKEDLIKYLTNYINKPKECENLWFKTKKLC